MKVSKGGLRYARRHAKATQVVVVLVADPDRVSLFAVCERSARLFFAWKCRAGSETDFYLLSFAGNHKAENQRIKI